MLLLEMPVRGALQAVLDRHLRSVAELAPGLVDAERAVIGEKCGPSAVERRIDAQRAADRLAERRRRRERPVRQTAAWWRYADGTRDAGNPFSQGDVPLAGEDVGPAERLVALPAEQEAIDQIVDIDWMPERPSGSEHQESPRLDRPEQLEESQIAGAIDGGRTNDHGRQPLIDRGTG